MLFRSGSLAAAMSRTRLLANLAVALAMTAFGTWLLLPRWRQQGTQLGPRAVVAELIYAAVALAGAVILARSCGQAQRTVAASVQLLVREQATWAQQRAVDEERALLAESHRAACTLLSRAPHDELTQAAAVEIHEAELAIAQLSRVALA